MGIGRNKTNAIPKEAGDLAEAYRWQPDTRCKDLGLGAEAHSRARGAPKDSVAYNQRTTTLKGVCKCEWHDDEGQAAKKGKPSSSLIGQKFFFLPSWKMWNVRIQIKNEDKNRFILNKEIVEKYKIVEISKYYLKGNIPSTVDVLRAGK